MIDVDIKFQIDGQDIAPDLIDDEYLSDMLEHTGEQARNHVHERLDDLRCPEHGTSPRVIVTAQYENDTEQMELNYHVDSCCSQLLLLAVQRLNH